MSLRDLPCLTQRENVSIGEDQDKYIEFHLGTGEIFALIRMINVERKKATADNYSNNDIIDETRKCQLPSSAYLLPNVANLLFLLSEDDSNNWR